MPRRPRGVSTLRLLIRQQCRALNSPVAAIHESRASWMRGLRLGTISVRVSQRRCCQVSFALRQSRLGALADKPCPNLATFAMLVKMKRPIAPVTSGISQNKISTPLSSNMSMDRIAREPVELGDDKFHFCFLVSGQGGLELRAFRSLA